MSGKRTGSSHTHRPADPLDRLRALRVRPDRAADLREDMQAQMKVLRKVTRTEDAMQRAWETAAPDHIARRCTLVGMRAGKAIVHAPDASTRYQAQQWLRAGGMHELSALAKIPLRGVQVRVIPNP